MAGTAADVLASLREYADPDRAIASAWFFQAGPGGYAEGDRFLGVTVPNQRTVARQHKDLPLRELTKLVASPFHEARLCALIIAVNQHTRLLRRDPDAALALHTWYIESLDHVDNWDLVDTSAGLMGHHANLPMLKRLTKDKSVWKRRLSMIATQRPRTDHSNAWTLAIAAVLVDDPEDLVQKAVGWMLREAMQTEPAPVLAFLEHHAATMPRTMLRYAIEKLEPDVRRRFMQAASRPATAR